MLDGMTPEELRNCCLDMNGAYEDTPFPGNPGLVTCKVEGKVFAFVPQDAEPPTVSLKCDPELAVQLRAAHPAIAPGWHLDKRHWNTVTLDGSLPERMVRELIEDSYDLVVAGLPRAVRLRLDRG
ncbi:MmcQ/YjbR family DNA-binding protein [Streptomyces thermolineatus]|uniref:MmcQ/YjbR family DNA-binding protein n=2 Tax=Streptomyces TaxID=1883 RepID=A0ABP5YMU8_9ACTN